MCGIRRRSLRGFPDVLVRNLGGIVIPEIVFELLAYQHEAFHEFDRQ